MTSYVAIHFLDRDVQYFCDATDDATAKQTLSALIKEAREEPAKFEFYKEIEE